MINSNSAYMWESIGRNTEYSDDLTDQYKASILFVQSCDKAYAQWEQKQIEKFEGDDKNDYDMFKRRQEFNRKKELLKMQKQEEELTKISEPDNTLDNFKP